MAMAFRAELKKAKREADFDGEHDQEYRYFVPVCEQIRIFSKDDVSRYICDINPSWNEESVMETTFSVITDCRALFATLIYKERGSDICSLVKEPISDQDLPLTRRYHENGSFYLVKRNGDCIKTMREWAQNDLVRIAKAQYMFNSPIFRLGQQADYKGNIVLPFLKPGAVIEPKVGGYSHVSQKAIHPSHHEFWDAHTPKGKVKLVAIKRLDSDEPDQFERERDVLTTIGSGTDRNPHREYLVKLLGTYKYGSHNHLIFHWATSNLRGFWDNHPAPSFKKWIYWSLKQMTGVAGALKLIHCFQPTQPLDVEEQKDMHLSVKKDERIWGRHGDIKPENFLYFDKSADTQDPLGVVQMSDFGLGRFHGRESRSRVNPVAAHATPTYEPPECDLGEAVSRKYDIWSLGCVYLEFLTWILKGPTEVYEFSEFRGQTNQHNINEDKYFEIFRTKEGAQAAKLKAKVNDWVDLLRSSGRCSMLVHKLLHIIMHNMLVVDQSRRISSEELYLKLEELKIPCQKDEGFMLNPVDSDISMPPKPEIERRLSSTWPPTPPGPQVNISFAG